MVHWWQDKPDNPHARVVLLHGAGAPADSAWMAEVASCLCAQGWWVLRAELAYMAQRRADGRKRPPPRADRLLEEVQLLVSEAPGPDELPLILAGKSMSGRLMSMLATHTLWPQSVKPPAGVLALGYPFHPPGKPERLRTDHFADMSVPLRVVQGTRDPMGGAEIVKGLTLPDTVSLDWVEQGNHDLRPLGLRKQEVWSRLRHTIARQQTWLQGRAKAQSQPASVPP